MGEIRDGLTQYLKNYDIAQNADNFKLRDIIHMCTLLSQRDCELYGLKCPLYKEHIGCLFRQGKTPREW